MTGARSMAVLVALIIASLIIVTYLPFLLYFIGQQWDKALQWNCQYYHGVTVATTTLDGYGNVCVSAI